MQQHPIPPQTFYSGSFRGAALCMAVGLLCILATVLFSVSCVVGGDCKLDTDCQDDQICERSICVKYTGDGGTQRKGCRYDQDCPNDQICYVGQCQATSSLFELIAQETLHAEQHTPDQESGHDTGTTQDTSPQDSPPSDVTRVDHSAPATVGLPPAVHAVGSGILHVTTSATKHVAIVGPMTPLVPSTTVMRSSNYSMRPGVISTSLW